MNTKIGVTVLSSGSRSNAVVVHSHRDAVLIDAGLSWRELSRRMKLCGIAPESIRAILVTHEHADHVRGLRVCANNLKVPVFASRLCAERLRAIDADLGQLVIFAPGGEFSLAEFSILPFTVQHDAVDPVGYVVRYKSRKVGVATDVGTAGLQTEFQLRTCDTLVVESNHDLNMLAASTRPWPIKQRIISPFGHLSNEQTHDLLGKIIAENTRNIILAHISQECNSSQLAETTARRKLIEMGREDIHLFTANQDTPLETIWA